TGHAQCNGGPPPDIPSTVTGLPAARSQAGEPARPPGARTAERASRPVRQMLAPRSGRADPPVRCLRRQAGEPARPSGARGAGRSGGEVRDGLDEADALLVGAAERGDVEGGDARLLHGLEAVADEALVADQRGLLQQLARHQRGGLVLLAVEVELLDLLGLLLVAVAPGQVVVEVLALGAHAADVEGGH